MRLLVGKPGVESGLSTSLDKADCVAVSDARISTGPEAVPVSVRSSYDSEAVTTLGATFLGVALVARAARAGVAVPGGKYSDHALHHSL